MSEIAIKAEIARLEKRISEFDQMLRNSGPKLSPWIRAVWETERAWLKYFKARLEEILAGQWNLDDFR